MFDYNMSVLDMNKIILGQAGTTMEEFIEELSIEDLELYIKIFKNENKVNEVDFLDIEKVGNVAFKIASVYQYKQSRNLL